ncbi:MAG: hypothetical protein ACJ72N_27110 [Labedaea sp.]
MGWLRRLLGPGVPPGYADLAPEENVLAVAEVRDGGHLMATSLGLWLPSGAGARRVGWHLISKATWAGGTLSVIEAAESGSAGDAVLIADQPTRRFGLARPGALPRVVHARITGSIRSRHHRELPGGGAWFVQRKVPGADGIVLQVRADPGTDDATVRRLAAEVAARLRQVPADEPEPLD